MLLQRTHCRESWGRTETLRSSAPTAVGSAESVPCSATRAHCAQSSEVIGGKVNQETEHKARSESGPAQGDVGRPGYILSGARETNQTASGRPPSHGLAPAAQGSLEGGTWLAQWCGRGHRRGEHRALEEAPQGKPCWGRIYHPQLQPRSPCTPEPMGRFQRVIFRWFGGTPVSHCKRL